MHNPDTATQTVSVSVVMAVYNEEEHVEKAITSILNQSLKNFELVIVNDGSTDRTSKILQSQNDHRIKIIDQQNRGLYPALIAGIAHASGKYIARLDADDEAYPDRLEKQLNYLRLNPQCGWLGTGEERVDTQRGEHTTRLYPAGDAEMRTLAARCIPYSHSSIMFPREVIEGGINYPADAGFMSDFVFFQIVAKKWQVANLREVLVKRRIRDESFFQSTYKRSRQNRRLAWLNFKAAWQFGLWPHHYCFSLARLGYLMLPNSVKHVVRRLSGVNDVAVGQ